MPIRFNDICWCLSSYKKIFNKSVAKTSALFLFFLPFFFGHLAINNKDIIITFAHVWTIFYLIKYSVKKLNLRNKIIVLLKISVYQLLNWYSTFVSWLFNTYFNYFLDI